jgi:hypothetical protein
MALSSSAAGSPLRLFALPFGVGLVAAWFCPSPIRVTACYPFGGYS